MWHDAWGWGIRQFHPKDESTAGGSTSAMRVLDERFARGEIDADEGLEFLG